MLAEVSDRKDQNGNAVVLSANDYYPFGMNMPGRTVSGSGYRYGFNGKEKDSEGLGGGGSTYDYGFRIYNPSIAKFLSVDPLSKSYPWFSSYQFAQNDPIRNIDIDGLEGGSAMEYFTVGVGRDVQNWWDRTTYKANSWWNSWSLLPSSSSESSVSVIPNEPAPPVKDVQTKPVLEKEDNVSIGEKKQNSTEVDYSKIATKLGVDENVIKAITKIESSGSGFYEDGGVKLRFEGHVFKKYLKKAGKDVNKLVKDGYGEVIYGYSERNSYKHGPSAYKKASELNSETAMLSTSFGAFQIMGFNYGSAGFSSVEAFVKAQETVQGQVESFINFISSNPSLLKAIKDKDFTKFAELYNGSDYKSNNYDVKMQEHYDKATKKD